MGTGSKQWHHSGKELMAKIAQVIGHCGHEAKQGNITRKEGTEDVMWIPKPHHATMIHPDNLEVGCPQGLQSQSS